MVAISVRPDISRTVAFLNDLERRQLPFATASALTDTAKDAQREEERAIERVFDRPTRFTTKAVGVTPARKTRLEARVFIKRIQADYLALQITGGTRHPRGRAIVLPVRKRVNKFGNIPRNTVKRLLARRDTFSGTVRGVAGIWQRQRGGRLKLMLAYEPQATYRKRYDFPGNVRRTVRRRFQSNFNRRWRIALATARR